MRLLGTLVVGGVAGYVGYLMGRNGNVNSNTDFVLMYSQHTKQLPKPCNCQHAATDDESNMSPWYME